MVLGVVELASCELFVLALLEVVLTGEHDCETSAMDRITTRNNVRDADARQTFAKPNPLIIDPPPGTGKADLSKKPIGIKGLEL